MDYKQSSAFLPEGRSRIVGYSVLISNRITIRA